MPVLDSCIADLFEPGNIGASSGLTPVQPVIPSLIDPDHYNTDDPDLAYSLDFSKFYNSMYQGSIV
jgi:hypothetical protein